MSEGSPGATTSEAEPAPAPTPAAHEQGSVATDLSDRLLKGRLYESLFPAVPAPTARLGRFVLLRELGRGGMGRVYAAYDEQLDRKVAVKLLHTEVGEDEAARARLLREAQALARLSHPNVVQVHEAGVHEDQVFLVMEYIEGTTLRGWLQARDEDEKAGGKPGGRARWRAVLELMVAAGEGLAAAHEAGLTHRDFKPDNLLVGTDGRVRVVDFGLAAEAGGSAGAGATDDGERTLDGRDDDVPDAADRTDRDTGAGASGSSRGETPRPLERLTRTGAAVGTVAYMPLEQLMGGTVDARSDQFSFCATLFEALFGERPFPGKTRGAIAVALEEGAPQVPTSALTVPRWLRKTIWQGLAKDPAARHADMRALLRALTHPLRRRRVWAVSGAVVLAAGLGAAGGLSQSGGAVMPDPCAETSRPIDAVWNDEARAQLEGSLPSEVSTFTTTAIDGWTDDWRSTAKQACEQVHVEQLASADSLDVRGRCLDESWHQLRAVLGVLESRTGDGLLVSEALAVLDDPADCLLDRGDPLAGLDADQLALHHRLSEALIELDVVQGGRAVDERRARVRELHARAQAEGLDALGMEAARISGRLSILAGDREATERWLGLALDAAERLDADEPRVLARLLLAESAIYFDLQPSRAVWLWERAQAIADRFPTPHVVRARSELARGRIDLTRGDLESANARVTTAVEQLRALGSRARFLLAKGLRLQATIASRQGDVERALELHGQARALVVGASADAEDTLATGVALYDEGVALLRSGKLDEARTVLDRARSVLTREMLDARRLARVHVVLSVVADGQGDLTEARWQAEIADAIIREAEGNLSSERVGALTARGAAAFREERYTEAAAAFELALRIVEEQPEPAPSDRAFQAVNLAEARHALGDDRAAQRLLDQAVPTLIRELGAAHTELAVPYKARGAVSLALGRSARAEEDLRRSLALHEQTHESPVEAAETRWLLAQALADGDRVAEASEQARTAAAEFRVLGPRWSERATEAARWADALEREHFPASP